jgi:hypothetical protein
VISYSRQLSLQFAAMVLQQRERQQQQQQHEWQWWWHHLATCSDGVQHAHVVTSAHMCHSEGTQGLRF